MADINPNNWHYTVDSGSYQGCVVVPLSVIGHERVMCSIQYAKGSTAKRADHVPLDPNNLTRLDDSEFGHYGLSSPKPARTMPRVAEHNIKRITLPFKVPVNLVNDLIEKMAVQKSLRSPIHEVGNQFEPNLKSEMPEQEWSFDEVAKWDFIETFTELQEEIKAHHSEQVLEQVKSYSTSDSLWVDMSAICAAQFPAHAIRSMLCAIEVQAESEIRDMESRGKIDADEYMGHKIEGYKLAIQMVMKLGLMAADNNINFQLTSKH